MDPRSVDSLSLPPLKKENFFVEILKFAALAALIVIPIRLYIAQPFIVSGASMDPTFGNGEYLIVDELSYRIGEPSRGDVIIFKYPKDPSKYFIKRIIGLPHETVEIRGSAITIKNSAHPEGFVLDQTYIEPERQSSDHLSIELQGEEYFVMGDNRKASSDSRVWGALPRENIIGEAFLRLFPIRHLDVNPGKLMEETGTP